jgi:hypothetical protein
MGYIQPNTFRSKTSYLPEVTQIALRVSVIEKAGDERYEIVFPFTLEITPQPYAYKLSAPFDQALFQDGVISCPIFIIPARDRDRRGACMDQGS